MKHILGSIMMLLLTTVLFGNEFVDYNITANKKNVVVNEAVYVVFQARQKIHDEVIFFDLKPLKSDAYEIIPIEQKRYEYDYHDAEKKFKYLVFAKKQGNVDIRFDFAIRRATDDAVAQTYIGSRDNVKYIPTTRVSIGEITLPLSVKKMPHVDAIGDFTLQMDVDTTTVTPFDEVHVRYTLTGKGYVDTRYEPLKDIPNVSIFRAKNISLKHPTPEGFAYKIVYSYALVAKENFQIPKTFLQIYNPQQKQQKQITIPSKTITIQKPDISSLIDKEEYPKEEKSYYAIYFVQSIYYILAFLAGFFARELWNKYFKRHSRANKKEKKCCIEIKNAKSAEVLLQLVMGIRTKYKLDTEIEMLETIIYGGQKRYSFEKVKQKIVEKLENLD
jgi:uncharacterized protein YihD (DUF1040 family)